MELTKEILKWVLFDAVIVMLAIIHQRHQIKKNRNEKSNTHIPESESGINQTLDKIRWDAETGLH